MQKQVTHDTLMELKSGLEHLSRSARQNQASAGVNLNELDQRPEVLVKLLQGMTAASRRDLVAAISSGLSE